MEQTYQSRITDTRYFPVTDKHETDATPPLDDCERWLEEEYFPKILPSFPPFEHVDRSTTVTFEDRLGVRCTIGAGEIAAAFLALVDNGLLPPVADTWRALIPEDLMPEGMLNRPTPLPLPPERDTADPAQYMAQFGTLKVHETALGCPCCGTRAHAVLHTPVSEHQVTERNVVGAMHQLALANSMPPLSRYWQTRMDEVYEPGCEADLRSRTAREGEL